MKFPELRTRFATFWTLLRLQRPAPASELPSEPSHSLLPLELQWVDSVPGRQVTCLDGCLLLHYEGLEKDIVLLRGESHACETTGRIAVQALVATSVLVH